MDFKYNLGQTVKIERSGEEGTVIARDEYLYSKEHHYLVQYTAADGRAVEGWFGSHELILGEVD